MNSQALDQNDMLQANEFLRAKSLDTAEMSVSNYRSAYIKMAFPSDVMERERHFLFMPGNVRCAETDELKLTLKDGKGDVLAEPVRHNDD